MNFTSTKWNKPHFLITVICLQLIVYITIFLEIPIARQILGFFYFTFLPGLIILKLLKVNELNWIEVVLLSAGLSIAFLMIAGLIVNEFCFLLSISKPLSLTPLMITLNCLILVGAVSAHWRNKSVKLWNTELHRRSWMVLSFACLPVLSIIGALWVNVHGNNILLLIMVIAIALLFAISVISKKLSPPKLYAFAVCMVALSLLYSSSLISNYVVSFGSDVPIEYFIFKITEDNAYWSSHLPSLSLGYGRINAMLSVTILPTIYSILLNIDSTLMFKLLFPLIFSLVPLGLYQVWQTFVDKKYAFISAFLFVAQGTFYSELLGLNRQMIAELFFVLLLLVITEKKMKSTIKMLCFMIFSFSLVTSHYSLAEIFLFFISFALISSLVLKRPSRNITVSMVVFFFVIMFTWYLFTSGSTVFNSFLEFGENIYTQLGDFFNLKSRGEGVLRGLGIEAPPSVWNMISRAFAYTTQALIVVGFVGLILRRTKSRFETEYFMFSSAAMALLAALILVPGLANTLNMSRFYHILLFFLAPFCVMGAEVIVKLLSKRGKEFGVYLLLTMVLVPYFLFQTGFVYEVTGSESWSLPLSSHRMDGYKLYYDLGYIDDWSVFAAKWMRKNVDMKYTQVYADSSSRTNVLISFCPIDGGNILPLSNTTTVALNGMVYLNPLNTIQKTVVAGSYCCSLNELYFLDDMSKIYANGKSEIYRNNVGN